MWTSSRLQTDLNIRNGKRYPKKVLSWPDIWKGRHKICILESNGTMCASTMYRVAQNNRSLQNGSKQSLFINQSSHKFVSIRSSPCLRHLQNIKSELTKLIAFQPLQSVLQMSSTALLADFDAAVEVVNLTLQTAETQWVLLAWIWHFADVSNKDLT